MCFRSRLGSRRLPQAARATHRPLDRFRLQTVLLDPSGKLLDVAGEQFAGCDRFDARALLVELLSERGLYRGKQAHAMRVGRCSRSGDVLEPMLLPQWFVRCDSLAERASRSVASGEMPILPSGHEHTWQQWVGSGVQDWCVSRQLWWGHRIPAYRVVRRGPAATPGAPADARADASSEGGEWIVARSEDEAHSRCAARGLRREDYALLQDEDVLDTWFSSALCVRADARVGSWAGA